MAGGVGGITLTSSYSPSVPTRNAEIKTLPNQGALPACRGASQARRTVETRLPLFGASEHTSPAGWTHVRLSSPRLQQQCRVREREASSPDTGGPQVPPDLSGKSWKSRVPGTGPGMWTHWGSRQTKISNLRSLHDRGESQPSEDE